MLTLDNLKDIKKSNQNNLIRDFNLTGMDIGNKMTNNQKTTELSIRVFVEERKTFNESDVIDYEKSKKIIPPTLPKKPQKDTDEEVRTISNIDSELNKWFKDGLLPNPPFNLPFKLVPSELRPLLYDIGCRLSNKAVYMGLAKYTGLTNNPTDSVVRDWHFIDGTKSYKLENVEKDKYYVYESVKTDVLQYKFMQLGGNRRIDEAYIENYRRRSKGGIPKDIDGNRIRAEILEVTGTFGAIVKERGTANRRAFLTCRHAVSAGFPAGDTISPTIPSPKKDYVAIDVEKHIARGAARRMADYTSEIEKIGRIREPVEAQFGMEVRKYGNTTGLTYGTVVSIDLTALIDGIQFEGQVGIIADLTRNWKFGYNGDSGSLVVSNMLNPIGLLVACNDERGTGVDRNSEGIFCMATPIHEVLNELGVDIYEEKLEGIEKDIDDSMRAIAIYPPPLSEDDPRFGFLEGHGICDYCCTRP